jgi:hypothetical protein
MLAKAQDVLHPLGMWERVSQATNEVCHDDLTSVKQTELSTESTQLFLRWPPDNYHSSLLGMVANAKTNPETVAALDLAESHERHTQSHVLPVNMANTLSGLNQNYHHQ